MKLILSTTIFLLVSLTLCGQANDADAFFSGNYNKAFIRKHKIRQVIVENHIPGRKSSRQLFDFDRQGLLKKQTVLDSSGRKVNEYFFIYNLQADQVERKNIAYELNNTYTVTFKKTYNGLQLLKETSSEPPSVTEHIYNSRGQRIRSVTTFGSDSTLVVKRIFQFSYDAKGRLVSKEMSVSQNGSESAGREMTIYSYDAHGNLISINRENAAACQFSYGKNGLLNFRKIKMREEMEALEILDKYTYRFWK